MPESRESAATLLAALDQLGEIVLITDTDGCITYANRGFERITGYQASEAIGRKPNILSSGETPVETYRELWGRVLKGEVWEGLLRNRRKDGSIFDCRLVIAPVRRNGEIVRLVSVQQDLSKHMELRRALELHTEQLEQEVSNRSREIEQQARALVQAEKLATIGELSASIAHEVLNPVMGISGAVQILRGRTPEGDPNRDVIDRVHAEVQRLDETLRGLLAMVRPRADEPRQVSDIVDIIDSALSLIRIKARDMGVTVTPACAGGPYHVRANTTQIRQIFLNLVLNAMQVLESANTAPEVRLTCSGNDETIEVEVVDNGPGIPDELLAGIFEPFVTGRSDGTGLGLSISRRIARNHGGDLTACNAPGGGACFLLTLPAAARR